MDNKLIPILLKEQREKNSLSVKDVASLLKERSIAVAPKTIYGWENGQACPSADVLLTLCEIYNIKDILATFGYADRETFHVTKQEQAVVEAYRSHPELQEAVDLLLGRKKHEVL